MSSCWTLLIEALGLAGSVQELSCRDSSVEMLDSFATRSIRNDRDDPQLNLIPILSIDPEGTAR